MKRIALLATLAMALPAAAYADPQYDHHDQNDRRDDRAVNHEHYDHYDNSHFARDFHGRWAPLARRENAANERQFIAVNGGRFRKLRIEGVRGEPVIQKVAIEFTDRTSQAVDLNERLPSGTGDVIDLNGGDRRVNRIIVYTDPGSRGSYSVFGS